MRFTCIDVLSELDKTRSNLKVNNNSVTVALYEENIFLTNGKKAQTPVNTWCPEREFTVVRSKGKRKR